MFFRMDTVYKDIASRTGGDIYIGVVGPVRSGKSTFIKKFMEELVIPGIEGEQDRIRARDELPQSASGRTVMTTEPKFIPDEAVRIKVGDGVGISVRMIDCVGYMVEGALSGEDGENGGERMVTTPWSDTPIPFSLAAETGTKKVISDHSTIGIIVTTDGTIGDIPRSAYTEAEERTVKELKRLGKPFAIVLNTADPSSPEAAALGYQLEEKYKAPVALVSCALMDGEDIKKILELILLEFPASELMIDLPSWTASLPREHKIREALIRTVKDLARSVKRLGDIPVAMEGMEKCEYISAVGVDSIDAGCGKATLKVDMPRELYYRVISEITGLDIKKEEDLISALVSLSETGKKYERIAAALSDAEHLGYGIVMPEIADLTLEEPEIVRQAGGYGVRLRAAAPSIHMIRANIETEINPIVGTEAQSEEIVNFMLREFEEDPAKIWESNMFGKTLYELVGEGLHTKLAHMPDESRKKLGETLERIINEGSGGLICIIL